MSQDDKVRLAREDGREERELRWYRTCELINSVKMIGLRDESVKHGSVDVDSVETRRTPGKMSFDPARPAQATIPEDESTRQGGVA
jgi:hypothetical protein